jgi:hypothetical protein
MDTINRTDIDNKNNSKKNNSIYKKTSKSNDKKTSKSNDKKIYQESFNQFNKCIDLLYVNPECRKAFYYFLYNDLLPEDYLEKQNNIISILDIFEFKDILENPEKIIYIFLNTIKNNPNKNYIIKKIRDPILRKYKEIQNKIIRCNDKIDFLQKILNEQNKKNILLEDLYITKKKK